MDALGGYLEPRGGQYLLAALFIGILCVVAGLERLQHSLHRTEGAHWWVSNGRDVVNLFAFALLSFGLKLVGFHGALVFLVSGGMVVVLTALPALWGDGPRASWASLAATFVLGLPVLVAPHSLVMVMKSALERLAP